MKQILFLALLLFPVSLVGQNSISIETRAYPAGIIPGIRADIQLTKNSSITTQAAYNFTNRRDWGKHDNEEGGGPGFGIGYTYSGIFTENLNLTIRSDFWSMNIDWEDFRHEPCPPDQICPQTLDAVPRRVTGNSSIVVFQPTIGAEYKIKLPNKLHFKPSLSFGYEINIKTEGEDVGEGAILLAGFSLGYGF